MNAYYEFMKDPKAQKAAFAAHSIQLLDEVLQDPIWLSMTTTLGMYRRDSSFMEILRSFWTTLCMLYGIESGTVVYDTLQDRLRKTYRGIGIEIDDDYLGRFLDFDDDEPDDL